MDNILEYIVFIFFLISILNGIFGKKKKKKQQQQQREKNKQPDSIQKRTAASTEPKKDTAEILEELFGLKVPKENTQVKTAPSDQHMMRDVEKYQDQRNDSWDPEEEFSSVNRQTIERPKYEPKVFKLPEKVVSTEGSIRASEKYHSFDKPKLVRENSRKREIKAMFKDPKTIRDYIIVQELLNEPKAFRM